MTDSRSHARCTSKDEEDFFDILEEVTEQIDRSTLSPLERLLAESRRVNYDGVESPDENYSRAILNDDNDHYQYSKQPMSRGLQQECIEIPVEDIMWFAIPRDHLPDEGKWIEDFEQAGALIISDFYQVCSPAETEIPSKFRATFPINDDSPGINYTHLNSSCKSVRRVFVLHYSEQYGLQCSEPESISDDGTEATILVDHFSWFVFFKSESMVLMIAYNDDYEEFSALSCKEAYFVSEQDTLSIFEYNDIEKAARNHIRSKKKEKVDDFTARGEIKRSIQATEYLLGCLSSECHRWEIMSVTSIFGNQGTYKYIFHDQTKEKIAESQEFKCDLDRILEDTDICDADKEKLKTFSLDIVSPLFGNQHQYGPYRLRSHRLNPSSQSDVTDGSHFTLFSMRIGFQDIDANEAREQIIRNLEKKKLLSHNELKELVLFLFRKEHDEQCSTQQCTEFLAPLTNAPKQRVYYGKAFMESWEKLNGNDSLEDALHKSRKRKIAVVLACKNKRGHKSPDHCIAEQIRIEKALQEHNGYEIIHVGNRNHVQPGILLEEHFEQVLEILREAALDPGNNGTLVSVMVWILGHGKEQWNTGMVDLGAGGFKDICVAHEILQTDDDKFVDVTNFIESLGDVAKSAREAKTAHFPIIVTNQFCREYPKGGGESKNYVKDPPQDMFVIYACSSGQRAQDKYFVNQWLGKYALDFKTDCIEATTSEVENIVANLNQQRPQHRSNLETKYTCKNGIYYEMDF